MKKRIFCLIITLILSLSMLTGAFAKDELPTSGKCGENVNWSFDKSTGTLTIDGTGEMYVYFLVSSDNLAEHYHSTSSTTPWQNFTNEIKKAVIVNGVTSISSASFWSCKNLTEVIIPESVTEIGVHSFGRCSSLTSIDLPKSLEKIGDDAFANCESLQSISFHVALKNFNWFNFRGCTALSDIYYQGSFIDYQSINFTGAEYIDEYDINAIKVHYIITDSSKKFKDVTESAWYKQYVDYAISYGIFNGTSKTTFSPNDKITRAQFVQVIANLEGIDTSLNYISTAFSDVPTGKWYTYAIRWASSQNIVSGMGNGKFMPNSPVTREQMCVLLNNYIKFRKISLKAVESKTPFTDDKNISKWAKDAVYKCQSADIINGKGEGVFDPKGTGTRAEASVMFTKFYKDYILE